MSGQPRRQTEVRGRVKDDVETAITLDADQTTVDLSQRHLRALDLGPIVDCKQMVTLKLSHNWLSHIDLSPIGRCTRIEELDLSGNNLKETDLRPVMSNRYLRELNLSDNHLGEINLSPLAGCTNLERLFLGKNHIEAVDLSPLSRCRSITFLDLSRNSLREINLKPLSRLKELRSLYISHNILNSLDLWPLHECSGLREFYLERNKMKRIDATAIADKPVLEYIAGEPNSFADPIQRYRSRCSYDFMRWPSYRELVEESGWGRTLERVRMMEKHLASLDEFAAQRGFFQGLELSHLGGYDGSLSSLIEGLSKRISYEEARLQIRDRAVNALIRQVESGGPTIFIETSFERTDLSSEEYVLLCTVVERRRAELDEVVVGVKHGVADLTPLYLTSYGHGIRSALNIGEARVDVAKLEAIRSALSRAGLAVKAADGESSSPLMERASKSLQNYVLSGQSLRKMSPERVRTGTTRT